MSFFSRKLYGDFWFYRALSILIAFLLWWIIRGGAKEEQTVEYNLTYKVSNQLALVNKVPTKLQAVVRGPKVFVDDLEKKPQKLNIVIDEKITGTYQYSLLEKVRKSLDRPLQVVSVVPSLLNASLDLLNTKSVPMQVSFEGKLPKGFKVKSVVLSPSTITLKGPRSRLQALENLTIGTIKLSPADLNQEFNINIDEKILDGLTLVPGESSQVRVTAELEGNLKSIWIKDLPLTVRLKSPTSNSGSSIINHLRRRIVLSPGKVDLLLEGSGEVIDNLNKKNFQVWVELEKLISGRFKVPLSWKIPPEIQVLDRSPKEVDVYIPGDRGR